MIGPPQLPERDSSPLQALPKLRLPVHGFAQGSSNQMRQYPIAIRAARDIHPHGSPKGLAQRFFLYGHSRLETP